MASSRYRKFLKLLEIWPLDNSKVERDVGVLLRKRVMEAFSKAEASAVNEEECDRAYASLQSIASDTHKNKWMRLQVTNATGSAAEALRHSLSEDGLKELGAEGSKKTGTLMKEKVMSVFNSQSESSGSTSSDQKST